MTRTDLPGLKTRPPSAAVCVAIVVALVTAVAAQTRDAGIGPRPTGTASLAGRVLRDRSPVARAVVTIDAGDGRGGRQTVTNDDGQFLFEGLPAGRFLVTASKRGWVTSYYGSTRPGRQPGVRVAIENGARGNVDIPMIPGGVIAGRIVNDNGQPMARQFPWLLESRVVGDKRVLARINLPQDVGNFERSTDDRGEFRFFGLPPGTYYLVVTPTRRFTGVRITTESEVRWAAQPPGDPRTPAPPVGPIAGYAPIYFPGTADPSNAQPIVVGPGEVRDGLAYRAGFVAVARVSGVVRRSDGAPACGSIVLSERDAKASLEGSGFRVATDGEGRFVLQEVPPGDYRITATSRPCGPIGDSASAPPPSQPRLPATPVFWGEAAVVVAGQNIEDVAITLAPASAIAGRIVFDGTTLQPLTDFTQVRLQFLATSAMGELRSGASGFGSTHTATVSADGTFRVEGLPPDRYLASASWPGMRTGDGTTGWWLTTIRVGDRDLRDAPIDVRANTEVRDVTLTYRDRIGAIEGVLTDPVGRPAPEYFVLAFPVERTSWTSASRRVLPAVRPGTDGRFRVMGLLPGEYYVAIVTYIDQDDGTDPAFLEAILPGAIKVTVAEGVTHRQDLRIAR